jgi:hypothetical protein
MRMLARARGRGWGQTDRCKGQSSLRARVCAEARKGYGWVTFVQIHELRAGGRTDGFGCFTTLLRLKEDQKIEQNAQPERGPGIEASGSLMRKGGRATGLDAMEMA